jgi:glutaredoxin
MKIIVYTTETCPKCPKVKELCREIAQEHNLEYLEKDIADNLIEALQNQVATAPSVMIDGEVICRSRIPSKEELVTEVAKRK